MKKFPLVLISMLFTVILCIECQDHNNTTNDVAIEIISPFENTKVSDPSIVNIHVKLSATEEIHRVEIRLTPKNEDSNEILKFTKFVHSKDFEYDNSVNLSEFPTGTEFQLKVEGCANHECGQSTSKIIFFTI